MLLSALKFLKALWNSRGCCYDCSGVAFPCSRHIKLHCAQTDWFTTNSFKLHAAAWWEPVCFKTFLYGHGCEYASLSQYVFVGVCLICSAVLFISALKIIKLQENSILRTPGLVVTKISATIIFRVRSPNWQMLVFRSQWFRVKH